MRRSLALLLVLLLTSAVGAAHAAGSGGLAVSQVFAGGGNSGATYLNDYVELLNTGSSAVDLGGYTLQYATASGTSWQAVALSGSLGAGRYYLVQLASGGTAGAALPTPDATGSVNLAATGGKVALVAGSTALTCGATAGSCSAAAAVQDLVGYGSATDYEGAGAAPGLDATHAALRSGGGCTDTGDNAADFAAGPPAPRNTASAAAACSGSASTGSTTGTATVSADVSPALSVTLDQTSLSFGSVFAGSTPPRVPLRITVVSNLATGYALSVHRSAFTPVDLPLAIAASAPAGAAVGPLLGAGALAAIPVAPASDLVVGTASAPTSLAGDAWDAQLGFASALPSVPPGHYQATTVFTVVGR